MPSDEDYIGSEAWIEAQHARLLAEGYTPGVFGMIPPCPPPPPSMVEAMRAQLQEIQAVTDQVTGRMAMLYGSRVEVTQRAMEEAARASEAVVRDYTRRVVEQFACEILNQLPEDPA